jgi:hypothetical protein
MARTVLTVQEIVRAGLEIAYTAANADGHEIANAGRMFLAVVNGSGSPINVTIATPNTIDGLAVADRVVACAAGETTFIGEFPPANYNQSDNMVDVDFSSVTTVTVGAFHI